MNVASRSLIVTSRTILFSNAVGNYVVRRIDDLLLFHIIGFKAIEPNDILTLLDRRWSESKTENSSQNFHLKWFCQNTKIRISISDVWWACGFFFAREIFICYGYFTAFPFLTLKALSCGRYRCIKHETYGCLRRDESQMCGDVDCLLHSHIDCEFSK